MTEDNITTTTPATLTLSPDGTRWFALDGSLVLVLDPDRDVWVDVTEDIAYESVSAWREVHPGSRVYGLATAQAVEEVAEEGGRFCLDTATILLDSLLEFLDDIGVDLDPVEKRLLGTWADARGAEVDLAAAEGRLGLLEYAHEWVAGVGDAAAAVERGEA